MSSEASDSESHGLEEFFESLRGMEGLQEEDLAGLRNIVLGKSSAGLAAELSEEGDLGAVLASAAGAESLSGEQVQLDPATEARVNDLRAQIAHMGIPGRMKLALFGNAICRLVLITDTSRLIPPCVLRNPRLQLSEVEAFSKNPNLSVMVLREIANRKTWMKSYVLKLNLVCNPRTPQDVALKWLRYLRKSELRRIARSKNLPQLIAMTARKVLADLDKQGGG